MIAGPVRDILHCHCENCRRITGNFVAGTSCATDDLSVSGDEHLRWYDVGYARYGFCATCGSQLFWQGVEHRDRTSVKVGSLDDASDLGVSAVWFADGNVILAEVDRERGPKFFETNRIRDPVVLTQRLIQERLGEHFELIRAVSFANRGK